MLVHVSVCVCAGDSGSGDDVCAGDGCCCRYDALLQEKEDLEEEFEAFRHEVEALSAGSTAREVRAVQKIVHNLEVGETTVMGV